MMKPNFSDNLVKFRRRKGLTQGQLAKLLSVTPQAVSKWEKGSYPDSELLPELAKILGVSLDVLFGIQDESKKTDTSTLIMNEIGQLPPQQRANRVMELCYKMIFAYSRNLPEDISSLPQKFSRETFAHLFTDHELAIARLNPDMQYFTFLKIPENGINSYAAVTPRMLELFKLLSDENALKVIYYAETLGRNYLLSKECISKRLGLDDKTVEEIIERFNRLGITWELTADTGEKAVPVYGYAHSIPLTAILTLAASLVNFIACREPDIDTWTHGSFRPEEE